MKRPGLRGQILILLLSPLVLFAPATVWVIHQGITDVVSREFDSRGASVARQSASMIVDDLLTGQRAAADKKLAEVVRGNPGLAYIYVVDQHGHVVTHTFSGGFPSDLAQLRNRRPRSDVPLQLAVDGRAVDDVAAPVLGGAAGEIHVGVDMVEAARTPRKLLLRLTMIGVAIVGLGVLFTLLLSERMARRLGTIARATEVVGGGDLGVELVDDRQDEIGRLARAFNAMASRLRAAQDERERTFRQMAQAEKLVAVGRLAAGVAHEINNPLSGVLHCLKNLGGDVPDPERWKAYRGLMKDGVLRAQRVVRGLLDYAKEHELDMRSVEIPELVDRSVGLLQHTLEQSHIRAVTTHAPRLPSVQVDPHLIEQVLLNLILNAIEAMPDGGLIEIRSCSVGECCSIRIRDHGTGMAADLIPRIFDPFFTTKGGSQGSGLGLSVSLGIVERHRGRIEVSSALGEGTTFEVFLPFIQPDGAAAATAEKGA